MVQEYIFPSYSDFTKVSDTRAVVTTPLSDKDITGKSVPLLADVLDLLRDGSTKEEVRKETGLDKAAVEELLTYLLDSEVIYPEKQQYNRDIFDWLANDPIESRNQFQDRFIGVITPSESTRLNSLLSELESYATVKRYSSRDELPEDLDILVSISENEHPDWQEYLLEHSIEHQYRFLPGRIIGTTIRVGPLTNPGVSPCYHCFHTRMKASSDTAIDIQQKLEQRSEPNESNSAPFFVIQQLEGYLCSEIFYALVEKTGAITNGSFIEYDISSGEHTKTDVLKLPGCDRCGTN